MNDMFNMNNMMNLNNLDQMMLNQDNINSNKNEMIMNLINQNNQMANQIIMNNNMIKSLLDRVNVIDDLGYKCRKINVTFQDSSGITINIVAPIDAKMKELLNVFHIRLQIYGKLNNIIVNEIDYYCIWHNLHLNL